MIQEWSNKWLWPITWYKSDPVVAEADSSQLGNLDKKMASYKVHFDQGGSEIAQLKIL